MAPAVAEGGGDDGVAGVGMAKSGDVAGYRFKMADYVFRTFFTIQNNDDDDGTMQRWTHLSPTKNNDDGAFG